MHKTLLLLGAGLAGVAVGVGGTAFVSAQGTPQITRTEILRKPMSEVANKEIVVFLADILPGGIAGKHFHPGDEAIYMLQGSLFFEPDNAPPFELKAGEITFNPSKHNHQAKNTSTSVTAKVLNCMIAEKGQPLAIPVQ